MIVELVTCDGCDDTEEMRGSLVPVSWIQFDGRHYCSPLCFCRTIGGDA
jgi:hypothetical protein